MSLYDANQAALSRYNRSVIKPLQSVSTNSNLKVRLEGKELCVSSISGSEVRFSKKVSLELENAPKMILLYGLGDLSLLEQFLDKDSVDVVLVYESQLDFVNGLLKLQDFSDVLKHPKLRLIITDQEDEMRLYLHQFFSEDFGRLMLAYQMLDFETPYTKDIGLNAKLFNTFAHVFGQTLQTLESQLSSNVEDAYWGLMNTVKNFPEYNCLPNFEAVKNKHQGQLGVVVATGPSLSQNLEFLKQYQDQCVIFCCDSAVNILLNHGITPDFVASLERVGATSYFFEEAQALSDSVLVAPAVVSPKTFKAFKGPQARLNRDIGFEHWILEKEATQNVGSSASHLCMAGLHQMGCSPIFLMGQDCAYDPKSGASHDSNAADYLRGFEDYKKKSGSENRLSVTGYDECVQETNPYWLEFSKIFPQMIHAWGDPKIINLMPAGYGLKIERTERMDVSEAFQRFARGTLDKKTVKNILRKSTLPVADLLQRAKPHVERLCHNLNFYQNRSLKAMQFISEFTAQYNLEIPNRGHDELYKKFLYDLNQKQSEMIMFDNHYFETTFMTLFAALHIYLGVQIAKVAHVYKDPVKAAVKKIELMWEWYRNVHLWSARVLDLIETEDEQRWHIIN